MTHQNHLTNGASLEDCHTNFFALTDLCGIKWRKFVNGERPNATNSPLDDPILRSYSRCMQADILCVWRRVQSIKQDNIDPNALSFESTSRVHPPLSLAAAKELWIFWYGEEPDLRELVDADLLRISANQALWCGTWERGLTYECRSLLFKALHNLMERYVLPKDIVRFGKWFVQPCTSIDQIFHKSSQHLSFSFTFFVHGDTVCASIDLREHPAVRRLTRDHLTEASLSFGSSANLNMMSQRERNLKQMDEKENNNNTSRLNSNGLIQSTRRAPRKVILAPFGMAAILTGNSYKASDPLAVKILKDWSSFFPMFVKEDSDVPPVVEVVSCGHKMYHPSIYVLVTDLDDKEDIEKNTIQKSINNDSSLLNITMNQKSPCVNVTSNSPSTMNTFPEAVNTRTRSRLEQLNKRIPKHTMPNKNKKIRDSTKYVPFYDTSMTNNSSNSSNMHAPPQAATEMPDRVWQDCFKIVSQSMDTGISTGSSNTLARIDSKEAIQQQIHQQQKIWSYLDPTEKAPCICIKSQIGTAPLGCSSTYPRNSAPDSMPLTSAGSPGTPTQSPLQNSKVNTSLGEQNLLNSSPHSSMSIPNLQSSTPMDQLIDKNTTTMTPPDQHDSITASPYVHPTTSGETSILAETIEVTKATSLSDTHTVNQSTTFCQQNIQLNASSQQDLCGKISVRKFDTHHRIITPYNDSTKLETENVDLQSNNTLRSGLPLMPSTCDHINESFETNLSAKVSQKDIDNFAEENVHLGNLYDFTSQKEWDTYPRRRFKSNENTKNNIAFRSHRTLWKRNNVHKEHSHSKTLLLPTGLTYGSQSQTGHHTTISSISSEKPDLMNRSITKILKKKNCSSENIEMDKSSNCFHELETKSEISPASTSPCKEIKSNVNSGGDLFTAEGLNPSIEDLEQLFETSSNEDCSSVRIPTPPNSNNPGNGCTSSSIDDINRASLPTAICASSTPNVSNLNSKENSSMSSNNCCYISSSTTHVEDLTKMFPTPPSHEQHHPNSSPYQIDIHMTDLSVNASNTTISNDNINCTKIKNENPFELGSPTEEPIDDWSYVYQPSLQTKFVSSSKYASLTDLPCQTSKFNTISTKCAYKPFWKSAKSCSSTGAQSQSTIVPPHHIHPQQRIQLHELLSTAPRTPLQQPRTPIGSLQSPKDSNTVPTPLSSGGSLLLNQLNCQQQPIPTNNSPSIQQVMQRVRMSPISPVTPANQLPICPMLPSQRHTPIHPPPPYEMTSSPAYFTSSYLNRQLSSQDPPHTVGLPVFSAQNTIGGVIDSSQAAAPASLCEIPEVSSLIVNILLYDTALNLFRDHNFDSSNVCVCNADSQKFGNIRGADSGVYVPLPGGTFNPTQNTSLMLSSNQSMSGNSTTNVRYGSGLQSPASVPGAGTGNTGSNSSSSTSNTSSQHVSGYVDDDPVDCTCGFSAVINRRLAYRAGLFYEDEHEITGIADDPAKLKKQSLIAIMSSLLGSILKHGNSLASTGSSDKSLLVYEQSYAILNLLLDQCSIIQTSSNSIHRTLRRYRRILNKKSKQHGFAAIDNVLEFIDANDIICLALDQARLAFDNSRMDINNEFSPQHFSFIGNFSVHKWPYIPVGFSRSNKDIVRIMNSIQPMLQNAFHSKSRSAAGTKDATYTVSGPLTWRQFHRLAGRASGQCEPQPIPSVIVGQDKDWVSVAPLAIHYWDKFLLEPYSYARDIVYLIICPDNEYIKSKAKTYFKELSSTYEMCKLGRHTPIKGWDGMLTVTPSQICDNTDLNRSSSGLSDEWLRLFNDITLSEKIRMYSNAFQNILCPYLKRVPNDKSLLNPPDNSNNNLGRERVPTSPIITGSNISSSTHGVDLEKLQNSPKLDNIAIGTDRCAVENHFIDTKNDLKTETKPEIVLGDPLGTSETIEDLNHPAIVLYVVEPFTFGSDSLELERLSCIAILICYSELLKSVPDSVRVNMNIQMISLESILELGSTRNRRKLSDEIKCLALHVFSQCRRHLVHSQAVKSLTGFGTAANMEVFLKSKDERNRQPYKMYAPPYILAPMYEKNDKNDFLRPSFGIRGLSEQKCSILYCNYCISEDQSWLLATVTDDRGELFEKTLINIDVPNRTKRHKAPVRRIGLRKLMYFIMGIISQTTLTWRLVIGRIGRIGHGELKSWSYLLSKQNLQKVSKQLKDICKQCTLMFPPSILSACLVTLEPDAKLRVMPDQFTPDERFSQISMQNPLSTPQDVTCTHILVFPTSAVCLPFTRQFQNEPQVDIDHDFLNFPECEDENESFTEADLGELLWDQPLGGQMSNHGSPDRMEDNRSWQSSGGNNFNATQQSEVEEVGSINQQPLAVGYMVSTAPTGKMPSWFWAACPHLEEVCPVFLKSALHLHVPNIQTTDDILNSTNAHSSATDHPLDSTLTADVLRYVLEGYNALSWLALDSNTHDRLSCLPINVQTLMDLYHLIAAIL